MALPRLMTSCWRRTLLVCCERPLVFKWGAQGWPLAGGCGADAADRTVQQQIAQVGVVAEQGTYAGEPRLVGCWLVARSFAVQVTRGPSTYGK